ncbi:S-layer homology domain-containing protein [Paenibacillus sinopodophylli]|uniref:S-layer homology domain-containing protein n=1 Tax=Paenibacillus sinopodophylli TaxID=1837342 RepID=UPI00110CBD60|nr:S-layer homology domain-containing protein [Paenibacillus sinopodophylli]
MKRARSILAMLLALLLLLTAMPVYANETAPETEGASPPETAAISVTESTYVRIQNKWQSNYLYEDESGIVRYGFPSYEDHSSQWLIEDYNGNKRFQNRATGHYITIAEVGQRRDALTSRKLEESTLADQWTIHDSNRAGFVVIKSATVPANANLVIHQEDQLGFAEASNDINITFESPQWALEPVEVEAPIRLANKFRAGQYLFEAADGSVDYGEIPAVDRASHWVLVPGATPESYRIKNRSTGHYITQGVLWEPIKAVTLDSTVKSEWMIAPAAGEGFVTFQNVEAYQSDPAQPFVLNTQFEDIHVRSNNWSVLERDNAHWRVELAPDVQPYRIVNFTNEAVGVTYLHEETGRVEYGPLTAAAVEKTYYQWVQEDFNGKKRLRNLATGHYMTRNGALNPNDSIQALTLAASSADDQWSITSSKLYDDYKVVKSEAGSDHYLHIQGSTGAAQAGAIDPNEDAAQWLFEDPAFSGDGTPQYVRIQNDWQAFVLYEDASGQLKYGNIAEDDHKGQWLIERFNGRKRIQNRATGHYINLQNMKDGRIDVTEVADEWTSAIWVIEDVSGSKLIHSVQDANEVVGQQKYISLQNLTKYAEYGAINPTWGSPKWKFIPVVDAALTNVRLKNKAAGGYLYEVTAEGEDLGKLKYGELPESDASSVWYLERTGDGPTSVRLKNGQTSHYVSMEHVGGDVELEAPTQQIIAQGDICTCWGSAKWLMEPGASDDLAVFKSGWASHLLYADGDGYTKVSKAVAGEDSAQFVVEPVAMASEPLSEAPIRIRNKANGQYLYENNGGIVLYGDLAEINGYSHWIIESEGNSRRLKNRATSHYMVMTNDYAFIESKYVEASDQASQWAIESTPSGAEYWIRSMNGKYNDELIHVQNNAGYAERGLYPDRFGTVQWTFEAAPEQFETPLMGEEKTNDTATPIFDDTGYVRIKAKHGGYLYENEGAVFVRPLASDSTSSQWLLQDFNGRRLLKNKASGHLLAWDAQAASLIGYSGELRGYDAAQWMIESKAGYKQLLNASETGAMLLSGDQAEYGITDAIDDKLWQLEPVASNQRYEAEKAFASTGMKVEAEYKGYTGGGYLGSFAGTGDRISFTVHAQAAGNYEAELRYLNHSGDGKQLSLYINGVRAQQVLFAAAGSTSSWSKTAIAVQLRSGINTIALQRDTADSGEVWLDSLVVKDSVGIAYRGATVPYITYEAEHGTTNAEHIGPSRSYREMAAEASGRQAVKLNDDGDYVEFTLAKPANSLVLRYVIPDSADGEGLNETLALYVNGEFKQHLALSSKHGWEYGSYPWSNDPKQGNAHRFFAEIHELIGELPAGAVIRLQKDHENEADYYVIDLVDMEQVEGPLAMPNGFLSVTDYGAVSADGIDDSAAYHTAALAAKEQGKGVWFPTGQFELKADVIYLDEITIRGAGMWYTTLIGARFIGKGSQIGVYDLLIDGDLNIRDDEALTHAFYGGFGAGSVIQNVWVEHSKTGLWLSKVRGSDELTDGLHMVNLRLRNLMADGINFSVGTSNSLMEQSDIRYPGDDGIAMWSAEGRASVNNTARFNTVALPWLADNFVIFGGQGNKLQDSIGTDTITNGAGIAVSTRFNPVAFSGTTIVERNTLIRTGSADSAYNINLGAIWIFAGEKDLNGKVIVRDNVALDSTYAGLIVHGGGFHIDNVTLQNLVLDGMGTNGIDVTSNVSGTIEADNIIVRGEKIAMVADANDQLSFTELNEGFANRLKPFRITTAAGDRGPLTLTVGESVALQVFDSEGVDITTDASIRIELPEIASIGADQKLTARTAGLTRLTVTAAGESRVYTVEVKVAAEAGGETGGEGNGNGNGSAGGAGNSVLTQKNDSALKEAAGGKLQRIVFDKAAFSSKGELAFTAAALLEAAKSSPAIVIVMEQGVATYEFPLSLVQDLLEQSELAGSMKSVFVFTIQPVSADQSAELKAKAEAAGLELTGNQVGFTLSIIDGSTSTEVHSLGGKYVKRTLTVEGLPDTKSAVALVYDKATGQFRYVPALFTTEDGQTTAEIMSLSNSIYAIAIHKQSFKDIGKHWAKLNIELLASKLIVSGVSDSAFMPNRTVTRAEFATMLVRALGLGSSDGTKLHTFADVSASAWYTDAITIAASHGIIKGFDDGTFRPNATITREQMAVMAANALEFAKQAGASVGLDTVQAVSFADEAAIHSWALAAVKTVAAAGILQGKGNASFMPAELASRAEAAAVITRLLQHAQLLNK